MWRGPWVTIVLAIALALTPPGQAFIHDAFFSGEQLSRSIAQPVLAMIVAILAVLAVIEWLILRFFRRRAQSDAS